MPKAEHIAQTTAGSGCCAVPYSKMYTPANARRWIINLCNETRALSCRLKAELRGANMLLTSNQSHPAAFALLAAPEHWLLHISQRELATGQSFSTFCHIFASRCTLPTRLVECSSNYAIHFFIQLRRTSLTVLWTKLQSYGP